MNEVSLTRTYTQRLKLLKIKMAKIVFSDN